MFHLTQHKREAATIRRIFKGEPEAYRLIIEQYQPMAYAAALAITGNVHLADKAVVAAFTESFNRLVSLTDPRRLGTLICSLSRQEAEQLAGRQRPDWNRPRNRDATPAVDLKWAQSELIEPLNEELGSFTARERMGILLYAFCELSARRIADALKIERKEAEEDLARTRENVEKALLKEVVKTLSPEVNNRERMLTILGQVAGPEAVEKASAHTRLGRPKRALLPIAAGVVSVLVLIIAGYFGLKAYQSFFGDEAASPAITPPIGEIAAPDAPQAAPRALPGNYTLSGRVVDRRFVEDGVAGLLVRAADQEAETDFYGAFEIRGVSRGQHDVSVYSGDVELLRGVRMHTEERNPPIEIVLDANVPARFRFQGRVFDHQTGQSITRFEVASCKGFPEMLQPYLLRQGHFREQRHPEGLLSDRFVTLGEYTMYVRAQGYAPLPLRFTIDEHWDGHRIHEFGLLRAATIEGVVYGANELSLARVAVMPRQGTAYGTSTGYVEYMNTDSMGRFALHSLPIGVQSFLFYHIEQGAGRAIVALEPGQNERIRVQFPRRGALTGDITQNGKPTHFSEFRRRIGGSTVDLTKNMNYNAPGQYEILLPPEPASVSASVAPGSADRWFERRLDKTTVVATTEPTWLDFNFDSGPGALQGTVSWRGGAPRALFVEVVYTLEGGAGRERIIFDRGTSGTFRLDKLPLGAGEVIVHLSPRAVDAADFPSMRALMDRHTRPFALDENEPFQYIEFSL